MTQGVTRPWWADAVVYQVYPRSFADSDGDGIGDLAGLRDRLPYLAELGVDAIWLTPFYPSPLADGGYDVSDYRDVDPRLGTLEDFGALVEAAAEQHIRVLVDLVPNHCSADHPLFRQALAAGPGSPERDMFIFREGKGPGGAAPPNNWPSNFGGPAWTRVGDGQWYLHLFDSRQPDWNWRDPRVPAMFADVIRFWLDRGAAGLRVDVAHGVFKDPDLADTPTTVRSIKPSGYYHRPEIHDLYRSWRTILDSYPADVFPGQRTAVGEVWYDTHATLAPYLAPDGLPQVFNFELVTVTWDTALIRAAIDATLALPGGSRAPWVLGNHDVVRPVTRFGVDAARPRLPPHRGKGPRPRRLPGPAPLGLRRGLFRIFPNEPGFLSGGTMAPPAGGLGPVQRGRPAGRPLLLLAPVPGRAAAAPGSAGARRRGPAMAGGPAGRAVLRS